MSQSGRSDHDDTAVGWEAGQYGPAARKSEERRRILIVVIVALLFICAFISVAVAAYFLI